MRKIRYRLKAMSYKINLIHLIHKLILTVLILTPIFSFQESMALIFGGVINNSTALTSPYIKGIKDLVFLLIMLLSLVLILKKYKINKVSFYFFFLLLICVLIPAFYFHTNIIVFLVEIRWLIPFFLVIFLINKIDKKLLVQIANILYWLFIMHFIVQVLQLFFAMGYFGKNPFGLSLRNPGLFFIPSTAGFFTILVWFFSKFYMNEVFEKRLSVLIPLSIFLTASGTAIVTYIVVFFILNLKKTYIPLLPIFLIGLAILIVLLLDILSGREGIVEESFGTRLMIFKNLFLSSNYLPNNFGLGTSTSYLIANKYGLSINSISTDSWYVALIVNLGLINFFLIMMVLSIIFIVLIISKRKEELIFMVIYLLYGATNVFTESFPANIMLGYYLTSQKIKYKSVNRYRKVTKL